MKRRRLKQQISPKPGDLTAANEIRKHYNGQNEPFDDSASQGSQGQLNQLPSQKRFTTQELADMRVLSSKKATSNDSAMDLNTPDGHTKVVVHKKAITPMKQISLKDLEAKFQQECDDILVSISQNWNTIHEMEIGKLESSTLMDLDDQESIENRVLSDLGSDQLNVQTLLSSHEEMPQTFTAAWVKAPTFKLSNKFSVNSQDLKSSKKSNELSLQGFKANIQYRKPDMRKDIP